MMLTDDRERDHAYWHHIWFHDPDNCAPSDCEFCREEWRSDDKPRFDANGKIESWEQEARRKAK